VAGDNRGKWGVEMGESRAKCGKCGKSASGERKAELKKYILQFHLQKFILECAICARKRTAIATANAARSHNPGGGGPDPGEGPGSGRKTSNHQVSSSRGRGFEYPYSQTGSFQQFAL